MFNDIFKQLLQNKGVTAYQMSKDTGISESLISNWRSGRQLPKYDSLNILADYFKVSGDVLLGRENIPNNVIDITNEIPAKREANRKNIMKPLYLTPVSAGTGSWLDDDTPAEWVTIPKSDETVSADFLIRVHGDSMQPKYCDGDIVLVKQSKSITEGEYGVFILNNEAFIKKMGRGELISINPNYDNIPVSEYDTISCAGKVIGVLENE